MHTSFAVISRSAAATIEELLHLREELKTARTELEEERNLSRSLESKLAISELDFIKATAQIIDLRGMIATDESDDDEDEEWRNPLSSSPHLRNSGLKVASRRIRSGERDRERSNRRESKSGAPSSRDRGKEKNREKEEDVNHSIYGSFCDSSDPRKRLYFFPEEMAGLKAATKNMLHHVEGVDNTTTQCIKNHKGALNAEFNDDAATTSDTKIAIAGFERNLATLRSKLRQGLIVRLWEEGPHSHVQAFECLMSLDRHLDSFSFSSPATLRRGAFSLFSQKIEIEPIRLFVCLSYSESILIIVLHFYNDSLFSFFLLFFSTTKRVADVVDCICNAASIHEQSISILSVFSSLGQDPRIRGARPNSPTLTIIVRSRGRGLTAADFEQPRIVSLQLSSRDDCNYLLSGMRTLIAASPPQRSGERVGNLEKEGAVRSPGPFDPIDVCHTSRHREVK